MEDATKNDGAKHRLYGSSGRLVLDLVVLIPLFLLLVNIVVPQFGKGCRSFEATPNAARSNLATIRSQLEQYQIQHGGHYPPSDRFEECLSRYTMEDHRICEKDTEGCLGPYLQSIPRNPYNDLSTVEIASDNSGMGDNSHGWHFNQTTGDFDIDWISESDRIYFK